MLSAFATMLGATNCNRETRMRLDLSAMMLTASFQIVGCTSNPGLGDVPYPAFMQVDERKETSIATMPGVRVVPLLGDAEESNFGSLIDIPPGWTGTIGGTSDTFVELFVLSGELLLSEINLESGGYAYLPAGNLDYGLRTSAGATVLYFHDESDSKAFPRPPIINERTYDWHYAIDGVSVVLLRHDTGNGSRTWLRKITQGTSEPWESSSATREGYLISGEYTTSECVAGKAVTGRYRPGGYFRRPPGALSGGPQANAVSESVWFFREGPNAGIEYHEKCTPAD